MQGIRAAFEDWITSGGNRVGQVAIQRAEHCSFILTHWEDAHLAPDDPALTHYREPEDARRLAVDDDAGNYRPLKTAPNLRHGWRLELSDFDALFLAIDFLYPAMPGLWFAQTQGKLKVCSLRETLDRQTGMYAVSKKITNEAANELVGEACRSNGGCLKTILWTIDNGSPGNPVSTEHPRVPVTSLPEAKFDPLFDQLQATGNAPTSNPAPMPLFCQEACNLLVAAAREVVKKAK
jgi:sirohydrochlorin cobaltochelatase